MVQTPHLMGNPQAVAEVQAQHELLEEPASIGLWQADALV